MKVLVGLRVLVGFCRHFFKNSYSPLLFPIHRWTVKQPASGGWGVGGGGEVLGVARKLFGSLFFLFPFWCGYRFPVGECSASIFG